MAAEQQEVFPVFDARLKELEKHVEDHDVRHADASDIPEFESKFFSLARDILMHAFSLPKGFTYEEAQKSIEASERSAPLRAKGVRIAKLLAALEYAPDRSYHAIDEHLIQLGELTVLVKQEPRMKRIEEKGPSPIAKLGRGIARATSILWFPFHWMYLSAKRKGHERKVGKNETYQVDELLKQGSSQLESDRLEDAIKTYKKLSAAYERLPGSLKAQVRDDVVSFHRSILERYESLKASSDS